MKTINWTQAAELGLVERINREILHPLGLAMCYQPNTGISEKLLIADDSIWEFSPDMKSRVIPDKEVRISVEQLKNLPEAEMISLQQPSTTDIVKVTLSNEPDQDELKPLISSFPQGTMVWLARPGDSIEVLSEDHLNKLGWYRKDGQ